jgi:hypothetical protein
MSAGALPNPLDGIRQTMAYDRAQGRYGVSPQPAMRRPPGESNNITPLPEGGGAATPNPYQSLNQEHALQGDTNHYANQAFNQWYGSQKPEDLTQFQPKPGTGGTLTGTSGWGSVVPGGTGTPGTGVSTTPITSIDASNDPTNLAGIAKEAARQHFMQNVLPKDAGYQAALAKSNTARDARINMTPLPQYQAGQDALAGTEANTAATAAATNRFTQITPNAVAASGLANTATDQANQRYAQITPSAVTQAQNAATAGGIANTQAQGMIQPNIDVTKGKAAVEQRQADANFVPIEEHRKALATIQQLTEKLATLNRPGAAKPSAGLAAPTPAPVAPPSPDPAAVAPAAAPVAAQTMQMTPAIHNQAQAVRPGTMTPGQMDQASGQLLAGMPAGARMNPDGTMTLASGLVVKRKGT